MGVAVGCEAVSPVGFDEPEIDPILLDSVDTVEPDVILQLPALTSVRPGDLFLLGDKSHLLRRRLSGRKLGAAPRRSRYAGLPSLLLARMVFTDPPCNVRILGNATRNRRHREFAMAAAKSTTARFLISIAAGSPKRRLGLSMAACSPPSSTEVLPLFKKGAADFSVRRQLLDPSQPHLRARGARTFGERRGKRVHHARRAVMDHCDLGAHADGLRVRARATPPDAISQMHIGAGASAEQRLRVLSRIIAAVNRRFNRLAPKSSGPLAEFLLSRPRNSLATIRSSDYIFRTAHIRR